ncbi:unnamed protein product [Caenorhabditis bovis]|uniref:Uncharacterized protein n=1 Tax=Caenorhabditis bovis TaxID=2654633 RepID=A0A8S1ES63_9PELO|nr:unnamed protein product [Caenorhabditis bovis]
MSNATQDAADSRNIFFLGLCVLFGWMIVILICASPHLFRNYLKRWFQHDEDPLTEKIRKAEARLEETLRLAQKPSNFLVDQAAVMSTMSTNRSQETRLHMRLDLLKEEEEEDDDEDEIEQKAEDQKCGNGETTCEA